VTNPLGRAGRQEHDDVDYSRRKAPALDDPHAAIIKLLREFYPWGFRYPGGKTVAAYNHVWDNAEADAKLRQILAEDDEGGLQPRAVDSEAEQEDPDPLSRGNVEKWNRARKLDSKL